jgi:hypothetical protein
VATKPIAVKGVRCKDGVVIGAGSSATFGDGGGNRFTGKVIDSRSRVGFARIGSRGLSMRVNVPGWDEPKRALEFGGDLARLEVAENYEFDFHNVSFATPGWLLGGALRTFRDVRAGSKRHGINFKHLGYADHVGFFKYFGMSYGFVAQIGDVMSTLENPKCNRFAREEAFKKIRPFAFCAGHQAVMRRGRVSPGIFQRFEARPFFENGRVLVPGSGPQQAALQHVHGDGAPPHEDRERHRARLPVQFPGLGGQRLERPARGRRDGSRARHRRQG